MEKFLDYAFEDHLLTNFVKNYFQRLKHFDRVIVKFVLILANQIAQREINFYEIN